MTWNFLHNSPKRALIELLIKLSEGMNLLFECNSVFMQEHEYKEFELETLTNLLGTMRLEINEANSTGIDQMAKFLNIYTHRTVKD